MSAVMLERDAVMAAVRGLLRDALGGRGGTLFVVGEAGMGKTTVLQYAVAAAGDRFRTGTGQADVAEAATFLSCGNRGLKTSAIWLIFVAAHAEKLVGLLGGAALTEHLNAMGAARSSAAGPHIRARQ